MLLSKKVPVTALAKKPAQVPANVPKAANVHATAKHVLAKKNAYANKKNGAPAFLGRFFFSHSTF